MCVRVCFLAYCLLFYVVYRCSVKRCCCAMLLRFDLGVPPFIEYVYSSVVGFCFGRGCRLVWQRFFQVFLEHSSPKSWLWASGVGLGAIAK